MKRTLEVCLGETAVPVGVLYVESDGVRQRSAFVYHDSWLSHPERFALSPDLPLVSGPHFRKAPGAGSVFHGAFADTEPDGWARRVIMRDHAKRRKRCREQASAVPVTPLSAADFLLSVDDSARVGAIRLRDEEGVFQRIASPRSIPPLVDLGLLVRASRSLEREEESARELAYLLGRATSLGGMRPKASVIDESGRLWIGKFPSVADERSVTKGEILAMTLAAMAGIDAAPTRLVECEGIPVALVGRFDRDAEGRRIPYLSAASLLGAEPGDPRETCYTEIVDAIRAHGHDTAKDIKELWRRIAFSILITNLDDHLRNHGFLHVGRGQWRLSPAFDLNPFPDRHRELKTWISEEAGPEASIDALRSVCDYFRLRRDRADSILAAVVAAVSRWRDEGLKLGMTAPELDRFADAFEHREMDAARRVL